MAKNTNFSNLKNLLDVYNPKTKGILTGEEVQLIKDVLEIESMEILELRNLRDLVVLYLSQQSGTLIDIMDKISAITSVIDKEIWNKGGEV